MADPEDTKFEPPAKADWHEGILADDRHISDAEAAEAQARSGAEAFVPEPDPGFDEE